jgi:quinol-cytochrome oxidoreductase complex cytochrome b subunit
VTFLLLGLHLWLVQAHGMSVPPGLEKEAGRRRPMKFVPNFLLRDLFGWVLALGVLASLAALFPWELGEKADPFAPAYADIRPEWYFVFMFETLKLVPGGEVLGVEYEAIPILLFGLVGLLLVVVPFAERGLPLPVREGILTTIGLVSCVYVVGFTAWGYRSLVPVYVVVLTALLVLVLRAGTARSPRPGR